MKKRVLEDSVANITRSGKHYKPSFKDLPPEKATHTRPLQITIECMGDKVPIVLINNGSALNVCPFRTTLTVVLDMETIIPSPLTVRAYDNTSKKVIGTFK